VAAVAVLEILLRRVALAAVALAED